MTARVALIGANGYGLQHRRAMTSLVRAGTVELVGLCDLAPVHDEPDVPVPPDALLSTDYRQLLSDTRPDVVIVATPPHTHLEIASAAVRSGADVLVEKPPFVSMAEHDEFISVLGETGRACQVGFQALGSRALGLLGTAIRSGDLGRLSAVTSYGAWQRKDSYYARTPWAGRSELNGKPVLDGVLVNPFAHSVMQCFALAAECGPVSIAELDIERLRARRIDVDDTAVARIRLESGLVILVAGTLCADDIAEPVVIARGTAGVANHAYKSDTLSMPGDPSPQPVPGRIGLLENLVAHRAAPYNVPLIADVRLTAPFTQVAETFRHAAPPRMIESQRVAEIGAGQDRIVTIPGVTSMLRRCVQALALPRELSPPFSAGDTPT